MRSVYVCVTAAILSAVLVLCLLYLASVAALRTLGQMEEVTLENNAYLSWAIKLDSTDPDTNEAMALYLRDRALLPDNPNYQSDLTQSLYYWLAAIRARPYWPYNQLGAFDAEYLLQAPDYIVQERVEWLITNTPNERGIDRQLFQLAILVWPSLSPEQQTWMIERTRTASPTGKRHMWQLLEEFKEELPPFDTSVFYLDDAEHPATHSMKESG